VVPLEDGQALKLTTSRYFTPSGVSIHERGIEPDMALPLHEPAEGGEAAVDATDPEILAAVEYLKTGRTQLVATQ
jgi:carboxyl-terminal processing protease